MEYSIKGRTIYPGFVVDIYPEKPHSLSTVPGIFRMVMANSGTAIVQVDDAKLLLEAPAVMCLNGLEKVKVIKSEGLECQAVYFKPQVINSRFSLHQVFDETLDRFSLDGQDRYWLEPFIDRQTPGLLVRLGPGQHTRLLGLLETLTNSLTQQIDGYWPCRSRSYFLETLFYLRNIISPEGTDPPGFKDVPDKLEDIILYLHAHYHQDISLNDLCARFAVNRTSLNQSFQRYTNSTVIQYLIRQRIRLAALLLRDTTVPVKELVYRAGFRDMVNFNRAFKKHTHYSPAQYRKEFCK